MTDYPQIPHTAVWEKIENGAAVVTVNRRLARHLSAELAAKNTAAGRSVWQTPNILPYSAWLETLYEALLLNPALESLEAWPDALSPSQEMWVWESVIRESEYGKKLLQTQATAKTAQQAWALCRQWRLDVRHLSHAPPPDTEAFIDWQKLFVRRCRRENWAEAARLPDLTASGIRQELIELPHSILFAGFDECAPQMQDLLAAIESAGKSVLMLSAPALSSHAVRYEFPDTEAEITHAAYWIRQQLSRAPDQRIGIIVPALGAMRDPLIRIFDDILHPGLVFSTETDLERIYNISLGRPLAEYAMVRAALTMLDIAGSYISINTIGELLQSPFMGGTDREGAARSLLEARLRKTGETEFDLEALQKNADYMGCYRFCRNLQAFEAAARDLSGSKRPSGWAEVFTALLTALEWPGDRTLSSAEYQTFEAWKDALSRLAAMDRVAGDIPHDRAIRLLKRVLADTLFQPETGDRPVQIMGVLEAAGGSFDALWVMGLHNEAWPPPSRPNPLIPVWIQRKYDMRHASAEQALEYARQITNRLVNAAPAVVFSCPRREGDAELFPSPLILRYPLASPHIVETAARQYWRNFLKAAPFDCITDNTGPAVADGEFVSGGTGLLKAQADCPFKAFAKYRLRAEALETPVSGLSAAERGSLVHKSLEKLWEALETHAALMAMPENALAAEIKKSVKSAVNEMAASKARTFIGRFAALESDRLVALITEWLEQERARAPFFVRDREAELSVTICGFGLKTVADRIDQLADGRLVIIDYKTGTPALKDWFTERMAEPQLPLYAISLNEPLAAVLFGQVRKGEARFIGIADDEAVAPGIRAVEKETRHAREYASIQDLLPQWRDQLETLGNEVKFGDAAVSPVSIHSSCRYCDFTPICRINERDGLESDIDTGG